MSLDKNKRWVEKNYTRWVATLPCANCKRHDETIVPHHLKHVGLEITSGMGTKASDWATMPLCFNCHYKLHGGDADLKMDQLTRMMPITLDKAFNSGILCYNTSFHKEDKIRKLYGEDLDD